MKRSHKAALAVLVLLLTSFVGFAGFQPKVAAEALPGTCRYSSFTGINEDGDAGVGKCTDYGVKDGMKIGDYTKPKSSTKTVINLKTTCYEIVSRRSANGETRTITKLSCTSLTIVDISQEQIQQCFARYNGHGNGPKTDEKFTPALQNSYNSDDCDKSEGGFCEIVKTTDAKTKAVTNKVNCSGPLCGDGQPAPGGDLANCFKCTDDPNDTTNAAQSDGCPASPDGSSGTQSKIEASKLPQTRPDNATIARILDIVFGMAAALAVLVIVIAGFRYITANGDTNAVTKAKESIIYAIIGLLIVFTAFSIVALVTGRLG